MTAAPNFSWSGRVYYRAPLSTAFGLNRGAPELIRYWYPVPRFGR